MLCGNCHEEVAIVSNYCPFCGTALVVVNQRHVEAIRLFCEGEYEAAAAKLQFARAASPNDSSVAKDLAHALLHAGKTDLAAEIYAHVVGEHRQYADVNFNYALLLMNSNNLTAARDLLQLIIGSSRVDFYPGRFYLGLMYPTLGSFMSDVYLYLGLIEKDLLRPDRAMQLLRLSVEKNPRQVTAYVALGDVSMQERNYGDAVEKYMTAMTLNPLGDEIADLHLKLGMAYRQTDNTAEAVKEFRWVLQRDPTNITALENLNILYEQMGENRPAQSTLHQGSAHEGASPIFELSASPDSGMGERIQIIGGTMEMRRVMRHARLAAASDATVLITGEHGTGKELIARAIVYNSPRNEKPFVTVNCAAIPEPLLESDLFGHEKGSFTGASGQKHGRFEIANHGTIFLDEIGDLSPSMQVKLLRVIQEREFNRVGGNEVLKVDIRVIAATNRNLEEAIKQGQFREDLFYRLNVLPIHIPPLRERRDDISLLVNYFLDKFRKRHPKAVISFSPEEMELFVEYNWPGNVRELENMIERAVVMGTQSGAFLQELTKMKRPAPSKGTQEQETASADMTLEALEQQHILRVLRRTHGNQKQAADILGINQSTLWRKLKRYGIESDSVAE